MNKNKLGNKQYHKQEDRQTLFLYSHALHQRLGHGILSFVSDSDLFLIQRTMEHHNCKFMNENYVQIEHV